MEARVAWRGEMEFEAVANSGFSMPLVNPAGPAKGASPFELTAVALAGCTAMDVISILQKKKQAVGTFEVHFHGDRCEDLPKVFTHGELEYVICGAAIEEAAVVRAIQLSVEKYCPVHAMLSKAFPISLRYSIYEGSHAAATLVKSEVHPLSR